MAVKFKYKKSLYTKQAIKDSGILSQEELRDEYTRLARLKNARMTRLEKAGYSFNAFGKGLGEDRAPKWSELLDKNGNPNMTKLSYELSSAYRFLNRKYTTVTGYKKQIQKSIKSFNKLLEGNPINENNIGDLFNFLADYRQKYNVQKIPDSDEVIDIFAEGERLGIDSVSLLKDIEYWKEHYEEMADLEPIESENPVSSNEYRKQLR